MLWVLCTVFLLIALCTLLFVVQPVRNVNIASVSDPTASKAAKQCNYVVIAPCYNEELILPHFLHHYRDAQKILIYDDGSTDNTLNLLKANPKVEVRPLQSADGEQHGFDDTKNIMMKNTAWKEFSNSDIDFVVIVDMDEFICSTDGLPVSQLLNNLKTACPKTAFFRATGFNMVDKRDLNLVAKTEAEAASMALTDNVKLGFFDKNYCKTVVFNPNAIHEIRYARGAHSCDPILVTGFVAHAAQDPQLLLCHFKYIFGVDEFVKRRKAFGARMSKLNRRGGFGIHYTTKTQADNTNEYFDAKWKTDLHIIDAEALKRFNNFV